MTTKDPTAHVWEPIRTESRLLPVSLTVQEQAAAGYKLAEVMSEIERAKEAKRADVVAHNRKIKALEEQGATLGDAIVIGVEDRPVTCQVEADFKGNAVRVRRLDDNAVVEERAMQEAERQASMLDPDLPGDAPPDTDADGLPPEAGESGEGLQLVQ